MKKSFIITGAIYLVFLIALAIANIFLQASWLSYAYVTVMLTGIFLNNEKINEGLLVFAGGSVIYVIINFKTSFYGEIILSAVFAAAYVVMYFWFRKKREFTILTLPIKIYAIMLLSAAALSTGYYFVLSAIGTAQPLLNSISTMLTVGAVLLTLKHYRDQYVFWIATNIVQIVLWATTMVVSNEFIFIIIFNSFFAVINIINLIKWNKQYLLQKNK